MQSVTSKAARAMIVNQVVELIDLQFKLLPPQSPRGFSALARLYYLARSTKTAMLRRLVNNLYSHWLMHLTTELVTCLQGLKVHDRESYC